MSQTPKKAKTEKNADKTKEDELDSWVEMAEKGGDVEVDEVLNEVNIPLIENGIVIDHLPPGSSDKVLHILAMPEMGSEVWFLMNVKSGKMGQKDVVKINSTKIDPDDVLEKLKSLSFGYTFNVIKDHKVIKKIRK